MTSLHLPFPLYSDISDALALGTIILDPEEQVVMWNRWMEDATGRSRHDVLGRTFVELFPELTEHRVHEAVVAALRYGHPAIISQSLNRHLFPLVRGQQREPIDQSVQVTAFLSGNVRYCLIQINDVTHAFARERTLRRQAQELREAQQRQLALLNGIVEMAWLKDEMGHYLAVNQTYADKLGIAADQFMGRTDFDFYPHDVASRYLAEDREVMESAVPKRLEEVYFTCDGQEYWVEKVKVPVIGATGKVIGTAGTARDITDRKRADDEIQRFNSELEQRVTQRTADLVAANRELEGITFATSHDLRGPLGRINSFSTLLERNYRDRLEGDGLMFLRIIRENACRLTDLVDDLLNHARISQQALELQKLDIAAAVQAVLQEKTEEILENGAKVTINIPPVRVLADPFALSQAVGNVVENALKYSSKAGSPLIEIGGESRGDRFRLWVRDNGIGFKMEYQQKIFQMFQRLNVYSEYTGSGIGLALVQRAMERMGGTVWAESIPGQGATFFLEWQIAQ